ncbi:Vps51/Vps67-domain-containing protein [Pyrenochaeta sp. MPI-SDFR-AT-0127]|nr:Vps51/Vps67-domain-containing protein [Pyrenochaeta sp. MPI-SDFR-AT-0127]
MSTIASPRGSISVRSPSSTRTSFDSSARPPPNARRNRTALREFYGLKNATKDADAKISEESSRTELGPEEDETLTELDAADFNAEAFVDGLLAREGLKGILRVEADLISQIRNLDSDRKSLVYDNYSKLLSATSTIRRMRGNMDPLAPTTHTLGPAISHIAETAASLSSSMHSIPPKPQGLGIDIRIERDDTEQEGLNKKQVQKETVIWVLDTPRRLRLLIDQERDEDAEKEWEGVSQILDQWKEVTGVKELREECERIMDEEDDSE